MKKILWIAGLVSIALSAASCSDDKGNSVKDIAADSFDSAIDRYSDRVSDASEAQVSELRSAYLDAQESYYDNMPACKKEAVASLKCNSGLTAEDLAKIEDAADACDDAYEACEDENKESIKKASDDCEAAYKECIGVCVEGDNDCMNKLYGPCNEKWEACLDKAFEVCDAPFEKCMSNANKCYSADQKASECAKKNESALEDYGKAFQNNNAYKKVMELCEQAELRSFCSYFLED